MRLFSLVFALVLVAITAGCARSPEVEFATPEARRSDTLLIMLPGRGDDGATFEREGFVELLRASGSNADYIALDPPHSLLRQRAFTRHLHHEVILPARKSGYSRIYLAGISQGGFSVLTYAKRYGNCIDGGVVFAPFLGPDYYVKDIHRQGGLHEWTREDQEGWWTSGFYMWPTAHELDRVWEWAQNGGAHDANVHIGWGEQDFFAPAAEIFASSLPEEHRIATHGGHEWKTWRRLWGEFLRRDPYGLVGRNA